MCQDEPRCTLLAIGFFLEASRVVIQDTEAARHRDFEACVAQTPVIFHKYIYIYIYPRP